MDNKLITGVYVVSKRWGVYWLKNKLKNIDETVKEDKFYVMLLQCFGYDNTKKILEVLSNEQKLIIDFTNAKVKIVHEKEIPFHKSLQFYFNPFTIQNEIDTGEQVDIYGYNEEEDLI